MPSNPLRRLTDDLDQQRARPNRLTGDRVLPPRSATSVRRVCASCWHVVDEQAEYRAWVAETEKACGCWSTAGWPLHEYGWGHWDAALHNYTYHDWSSVSCCPRCGGVLDEVGPA